MKQKIIILGMTLFVMGIIGVLSILTMEISLPPEVLATLEDKFTTEQIKLLILINPTIMLIVAVIIGASFYNKVNLKVPIIENLIRKSNKDINLSGILKAGIVGGVMAGVLLSLMGMLSNSILPQEFLELGENFKPGIASRFLYGGITEEILMRFGLMTFIVWIMLKIFKELKPKLYWYGIIISAIIFALGHFPIAFQILDNPSNVLLLYILIANSVGGIIFGWLYWKKGLESAIIAHMFTHLIMLISESIIN